MADKFDPAPPDTHAEDPKAAQKADRKQSDELEKGLKESFPASDPASSASPKQKPGA